MTTTSCYRHVDSPTFCFSLISSIKRMKMQKNENANIDQELSKKDQKQSEKNLLQKYVYNFRQAIYV